MVCNGNCRYKILNPQLVSKLIPILFPVATNEMLLVLNSCSEQDDILFAKNVPITSENFCLFHSQLDCADNNVDHLFSRKPLMTFGGN